MKWSPDAASNPKSFLLKIVKIVLSRVEAPIINHLRDFAPDLEGYKVV